LARASRLARLDRKVDEKDRATIEEVSNGLSLKEVANRLLDAVDLDAQRSEAQVIFWTDNPTPSQIK
jgi:hypothetical protein